MLSRFSLNNQVIHPVKFFSLHDYSSDLSSIKQFQALVKKKLNIEISFQESGAYTTLYAKNEKDATRLKTFLKNHIQILVCLSTFNQAGHSAIKPLKTNRELLLVDNQCARQAGIIFSSNEIARYTFVSSLRNYRESILPWSKTLHQDICLEVKPTLPPFYMFTSLDTFNLFEFDIIS